MARMPRYFVPDQPQHIIQRGNNRGPIFASEEDYRFYLECLYDAADKQALAIHAYVLMTNHVHLLATPQDETSIPKTLQSVGRRYVQYFDYHYSRPGTLWEDHHKATVIDSTHYLFTCSRYIELNPVRAGMVGHPREYPWSSYHHNAQGKADRLITAHCLYRRLGRTNKERHTGYRHLFRSHLSEHDVTTIQEATNKGWTLGNSRFREKVKSLSKRRSKPLPRGKPGNDDS